MPTAKGLPSPCLFGARGKAKPTATKASHREPVHERAAAVGPPTVANLGPGFDWLGAAVEGEGDVVEASWDSGLKGSVAIDRIEGDEGRLPLDSKANCAGVAASYALDAMASDRPHGGVRLVIRKGLPLGSGLGSSAASAAAAGKAVACLFDDSQAEAELVQSGLEGEAAVAGRHADNIAPAVLGGFVLVSSVDPPRCHRLPLPRDCDPPFFSLVRPDMEAPTAEMRSALPTNIPLKDHVSGAAAGGGVVAGCLKGDLRLLGRSLDSDTIVEPVRARFIPGFALAKERAKAAGALGCSVSGAGPTAVALGADQETARKAALEMVASFREEGVEIARALVAPLCLSGAQCVPPGTVPSLPDDVVAIV